MARTAEQLARGILSAAEETKRSTGRLDGTGVVLGEAVVVAQSVLDLLAALEAMMAGNEWAESREYQGVKLQPSWVRITMPTVEAINAARAAIAKAKGGAP